MSSLVHGRNLSVYTTPLIRNKFRQYSSLKLSESTVILSKSIDPFINLATEEWILNNSGDNTTILFLYRNRPSVIIGRNQNPWRECNLNHMRERGIQLVRRISGGGAVYHDMGNTNYSVVMARDQFDRDKHALMVCRALENLDISASVNSKHDIVVDKFKVSGSAYKIVRKRAFHHGTMLVDVNHEDLSKSLHTDQRIVDAKGVASVRSKVAGLRDYSWTVDHHTLCESIIEQFGRIYSFGTNRFEIDDTILDKNTEVKEIVEKLKSHDWMYGSTPEFSLLYTIDILGSPATFSMTVNRGVIQSLRINELDSSESTKNSFQDATKALESVLKGITFSRWAMDLAKADHKLDTLSEFIFYHLTKNLP